jgi:hypothetical protein
MVGADIGAAGRWVRIVRHLFGAIQSNCLIRAMPTRLKVECYAGFKADERPTRFSFIPSESAQPQSSFRSYEVIEVLDRWHGRGYEGFRVRADDHNLYILRHELGEDTWRLDAFRSDLGFAMKDPRPG